MSHPRSWLRGDSHIEECGKRGRIRRHVPCRRATNDPIERGIPVQNHVRIALGVGARQCEEEKAKAKRSPSVDFAGEETYPAAPGHSVCCKQQSFCSGRTANAGSGCGGGGLFLTPVDSWQLPQRLVYFATCSRRPARERESASQISHRACQDEARCRKNAAARNGLSACSFCFQRRARYVDSASDPRRDRRTRLEPACRQSAHSGYTIR